MAYRRYALIVHQTTINFGLTVALLEFRLVRHENAYLFD